MRMCVFAAASINTNTSTAVVDIASALLLCILSNSMTWIKTPLTFHSEVSGLGKTGH